MSATIITMADELVAPGEGNDRISPCHAECRRDDALGPRIGHRRLEDAARAG